MDLEPLTGRLGAIVHGLDLSATLTDDQRRDLREALVEHQVLFWRDQHLDEDEQLAFASTFGPPVAANAVRAEGDEELLFVTLEDTTESPPKADRWHTDLPFIPRPPDVAVLCMLDAPPAGGDTLWVDLHSAYESLSPPMRAAIAHLRLDLGLGASADTIRELYGDDYHDRVVARFAEIQHPLVRVHPVSGRPALYLCGSFMNGIVGMHPDESALLLGFLQARLDDPNLHCRWRWRAGDVAVWDERCTNHRALSDHAPAHRLVRRCLAGDGEPIGPVPVSEPAESPATPARG